MNREIIEPFQGKHVKIVLEGNFALNGKINQVYEDSILFTTSQKTAVIRFDRIQEICSDKGGGNDR